MSLVKQLIEKGFNQSHPIPFERGTSIGCSQCEALCINGVPCHEAGCPNQRYECHGCNADVARGVRYCEECGQ
jgi:hypothetical protein